MKKLFQTVNGELSKLKPWQIIAQVSCGFLLASALFWALFPHLTS